MGYLTTHVLDTTHGIPAQGVTIKLYEYKEGEKILVSHTTTNRDGRCDQPILTEESFHIGVFELEFAIGSYYRAQNLELTAPFFLDDVVIRFGINDESSHYHVPVLVSPYGYSTYRGS